MAVAIDGGQEDYFKVTAGKLSSYNFYKLEIKDVTSKDLYKDWNEKINKYGLIENPDKSLFISIMENKNTEAKDSFDKKQDTKSN